MKYLFMFVLGLSFSCSVFSQIQKIDEKSNRRFAAKAERLYRDIDKYMLCSMAYFRLVYTELPDNNSFYQIEVIFDEGKLQFHEGARLLLKLKDDSILELQNTKEIKLVDNEVLLSHVYVSPLYNVTEEDLKKIIAGEVVKIRVEHSSGYFDRSIKKNKFSKGLKTMYENSRSGKHDVYQKF